MRFEEKITNKQILEWADAHHRRTGQLPRQRTAGGPAPGVTWSAIHWALYLGNRGLPGGSSLPRLLAEQRGVRNKGDLPRLTIRQILQWADAHHARSGQWPHKHAGVVTGGDGTTWIGIDQALSHGLRGLKGGSSLPKLLNKERGVPTKAVQMPLTVPEILKWADAHHRRTGRWPNRFSGRCVGAKDLTWSNIEGFLFQGTHGLPRRTTLPKLLAEHRGVRNRGDLPQFSAEQLLGWADAHRARTGRWPTQDDGAVEGAPGEDWGAINSCLRHGFRGLPKSSLVLLWKQHRGYRSKGHAPPLTIEEILHWSDAHHRRTGQWQKVNSGPIPEAPGETWNAVNFGLLLGHRGLPGGSSLPKLLEKHRGVRNLQNRPRLSVEKILEWADQQHHRTGRWPNRSSGPVTHVPGESWNAIEVALAGGSRGLPKRLSIIRVLSKHRGVYNRMDPPPLTITKILQWADDHYERTGDWPSRDSGRVLASEHETWARINSALKQGRRTLRGPSTLVKVLSTHRKDQYRRKGQPLTRDMLLEWAAVHHEFTGSLPTMHSGLVRDQPGENWKAIDASLRTGSRGLKMRRSLADFLEAHYVAPYPNIGQRLSEAKIIRWAEDFRRRAGFWPTPRSAYVIPPGRGKDGEKWATIDTALREGLRGLPGGSSLEKLLRGHWSARKKR